MSPSPYDDERIRLEAEAKHDLAIAEQRKKVQEEARRRQHIAQVKIDIEKLEREMRQKDLELRALKTQALDTERIQSAAKRSLFNGNSQTARLEEEEEQVVNDLTHKLEQVKQEERQIEENIHKHEARLEQARRDEKREDTDKQHLEEKARMAAHKNVDLQSRTHHLETEITELKRKIDTLTQELHK